MGSSAKFDEPIALPDGHKLVTLQDAGEFITTMPAATQARAEWQAATEALILVAESGGPTMLAHIGMMRAINGVAPATAKLKLSPTLIR